MKSKRKLVRTAPAGETPAIKPASPNDAYDVFAKEMRSTKTPMAILRARYKELFKTNPPAVSEELIKAKISYHLLVVEGYQKCNVPVPEKVMKNYLASKELNIDGFCGAMSDMMKLKTTTKKEEEGDMATKKVVKVVKKASPAPAKAAKEEKPHVTVSSIFAEIFAANFTKKLSDEGIAKEINVKSKGIGRGHQYAAKDIPAVRRKFNLGILAGQSGKPKAALERFEAKK